MPIIEPIDHDEARERGLEKQLDSFVALGDAEAIFPRILGHAPGYAEALVDAMTIAHTEGGVDPQLKELMRIQLARTAGDPYFAGLRATHVVDDGLTEGRIEAGVGDFEDNDEFSPAEEWALRYAHLMYRQPERIDRDFYDEGKRHFTEAQIMEMGGMIAIHYGMQVFMRTLHAT